MQSYFLDAKNNRQYTGYFYGLTNDQIKIWKLYTLIPTVTCSSSTPINKRYTVQVNSTVCGSGDANAPSPGVANLSQQSDNFHYCNQQKNITFISTPESLADKQITYVVIIGVLVAVGVLLFCIVCLCIRRQHSKNL